MPQPLQNNQQQLPYPAGPPSYDQQQQPRPPVVVTPVVVTQQPGQFLRNFCTLRNFRLNFHTLKKSLEKDKKDKKNIYKCARMKFLQFEKNI